jgi:polynucleotide 5'-kinase involved in rRNA processing
MDISSIIELPEKSWFILRGNGNCKILSGTYKLFNKKSIVELDLKFNSGDSFILFTESKVKISTLNVKIEKLLSNPIPQDWIGLKIEIQPVKKNKIVIIGASDSGKSTLIKYIAYNLPKLSQRIGIVDLDVGQNSFLPGTINLSEFSLSGIKFVDSRFFGHLTPSNNQLIYLDVVKIFLEKISKMHFDWLLFDTTGYIQTDEALLIKKQLLSIINPQYTILLGNEVLKWVKLLPTKQIRYLLISSAIQGIKIEKSLELRRSKRKERFLAYFHQMKSIEVSFSSIALISIYKNNKIDNFIDFIKLENFFNGYIATLNDSLVEIVSKDEDKPFYGKLEGIDAKRLILQIPITKKLSEGISIKIGSIKLDFL